MMPVFTADIARQMMPLFLLTGGAMLLLAWSALALQRSVRRERVAPRG